MTIYKSDHGARLVQQRYLKFLNHWPAANQQRRVPTREGETFIVACGDEQAPPLLLLHGAAANSAMWMGDVAQWAAHFRVYAIDVIGEPGFSAPSRPPLASEAHALWQDDVMRALSITRTSIVGVSLGGWLALDYATRRPERVESLIVLCPGGVGRAKIGVLFAVFPLLLLGPWGRRKARELILGRAPAKVSVVIQHFIDFVSLINRHFQPRRVKLPVFSNDALKCLTMPVLAIVGGKDVLFDSAETKRRLERNLAHAKVRYLPNAGHMIPGQTAPILEFLRANCGVGCRA